MAVFGDKCETVVYYDFNNILSFREIVILTFERYDELVSQGFDSEQAKRIIFHCSHFKNAFLDETNFNDLKSLFNVP